MIGHEIGHVALRHGTNQASKSYMAQAPLAILGSLMGNNSVPAIVAQIRTSFAASSILLKYSRDDERQADLMGAQILYDASYDPRYVAQFFEKLDSKEEGRISSAVIPIRTTAYKISIPKSGGWADFG